MKKDFASKSAFTKSVIYNVVPHQLNKNNNKEFPVFHCFCK